MAANGDEASIMLLGEVGIPVPSLPAHGQSSRPWMSLVYKTVDRDVQREGCERVQSGQETRDPTWPVSTEDSRGRRVDFQAIILVGVRL